MARSFLGARARSVLVALWALSDEATMTMKYFHKELVAGKRASEALRQATNFMREIEWLGKYGTGHHLYSSVITSHWTYHNASQV